MTRSITSLAISSLAITSLASAAIIMAAVSGPAFAQGAPQNVTLARVDLVALATGYRTSKVVGSTVVNELNVTLGTIDDLIVTPSEKVPFAVLSVGGVLGVGTKYVVVPFSALEFRDKRIVLPATTKETLGSLPEFKYSN